MKLAITVNMDNLVHLLIFADDDISVYSIPPTQPRQLPNLSQQQLCLHFTADVSFHRADRVLVMVAIADAQSDQEAHLDSDIARECSSFDSR